MAVGPGRARQRPWEAEEGHRRPSLVRLSGLPPRRARRWNRHLSPASCRRSRLSGPVRQCLQSRPSLYRLSRQSLRLPRIRLRRPHHPSHPASMPPTRSRQEATKLRSAILGVVSFGIRLVAERGRSRQRRRARRRGGTRASLIAAGVESFVRLERVRRARSVGLRTQSRRFPPPSRRTHLILLILHKNQ
jgi:hypothetical protein